MSANRLIIPTMILYSVLFNFHIIRNKNNSKFYFFHLVDMFLFLPFGPKISYVNTLTHVSFFVFRCENWLFFIPSVLFGSAFIVLMSLAIIKHPLHFGDRIFAFFIFASNRISIKPTNMRINIQTKMFFFGSKGILEILAKELEKNSVLVPKNTRIIKIMHRNRTWTKKNWKGKNKL